MPASFDEVARELTLRGGARGRAAGGDAARGAAGRVLRLDRPTPRRPAARARSATAAGGWCSSCDVGGGTTDFSLIRAQGRGRAPVVARALAVGRSPAARRRQHGPRAGAPRSRRGSAAASSTRPASTRWCRPAAGEGAAPGRRARRSAAPVAVVGARAPARRRARSPPSSRGPRSWRCCSTVLPAVRRPTGPQRARRPRACASWGCRTRPTRRSPGTSPPSCAAHAERGGAANRALPGPTRCCSTAASSRPRRCGSGSRR